MKRSCFRRWRRCLGSVVLGLACVAGASLARRGWSADAPPVTVANSTNGFSPLDLAAWANADGDWNLLPAFSTAPTGVQTWNGVPFRVGPPRAVTGLQQAREGQFHPPTLPPVRLGLAAQRFHLVATTLGEVKDGTPVAQLVLGYPDGTEERVRLGYGVHLREWVRGRGERRESAADPRASIAWTRGGELDGGVRRRLYHAVLDNPRPGEVVAWIALESLFSSATPVVLAVTAEEASSGRPALKPGPPSKPLRDLVQHPVTAYRDEFRVRATDGDGGAPLTNATALITVTDDARTFYFGEVRADADGVCRVPFPPQATVGFSLLVRAPDRVPVVLTEWLANRPRFSREFTAALRPGLRIGGVVKGANGQPIEGAEVLLHRVEKTGAREYWRTDFAVVRTGADGRWTTASAPVAFTNFSFEVSHPEFRPALYVLGGPGGAGAAAADAPASPGPRNPVPREAGPEQIVERVQIEELGVRSPRPAVPPARTRVLGARTPAVREVSSNALATAAAEFVLAPALRVEGTLLGHDEKPIPAAELFLLRTSPVYERRRLQTDAAGRFRVAVPEPGEGALVVVREGFTPLHQYLNLEPGLPPLVLKLAPPRTLRGRVLDRQQQPVPGARVRLEDWQGSPDWLSFQAVTDANGAFQWTGAPADSVTFLVSKTNCYNMRTTLATAAGEVRLFINRMPGISGRVLDAETGRPIDTFIVVRGRKYGGNDEQVHWERYETLRGRDGEYFIRLEEYYFQPEARLMVEAPGYVPVISPGFTRSGTHTHDFRLKKGQGLRGEVRLPDGQPASGATVVLLCQGDNGYMDTPGQLRAGGNNGELSRTDVRGRFEFQPKLQMESVVAVHEAGFAQLQVPESATNLTVQLQAWARVEGVMQVGDRPDPERWVVLLQDNSANYDPSGGRASFLGINLRVDPDPDGRFVIEKAPPGRRRIEVEYRLRERNYDGTPYSHGRALELKPGTTNVANLGGSGRQVIGRVQVSGGDVSDVDWRRDIHRLVSVPAAAARPSGLAALVGGLLGANPAPPAGSDVRTYVAVFESNGTFRVDHVPPGRYSLQINVTDPDEEYYNRRPMGNAQQEVIVPEDPAAKVNAPLDIGAVALRITPKLRIGRPVPGFEAKTFDGQPAKLADYQGRPVLLFFWASFVGLGSYDLNVLRELHTTYGAQGKLVVLGVNVDPTLESGAQFARGQNITWPQVHLGAQSTVPAGFGIQGYPSGLLIDAEGRLVARDLRGAGLRNAVRNLLE